MKAQVYKDPRPAEYFDRFHTRVREHEPNWVYELVRVVTVLYGLIFFRMRCIASDNVPASGRVILAPNHFSFMDHFFTGAFTRRRVNFMAKSQLFTKPMEWIYSPGGVFPVRRGHYDEDAFITAEAILDRDGAIVMYCEGGRSRSGRVSDKRAARHRPARAAVRHARRADRDLRLSARAQLEEAAVPEGARAVRRADPSSRRSRSRRASSSRRPRTRSSARSRRSTATSSSSARSRCAVACAPAPRGRRGESRRRALLTALPSARRPKLTRRWTRPPCSARTCSTAARSRSAAGERARSARRSRRSARASRSCRRRSTRRRWRPRPTR